MFSAELLGVGHLSRSLTTYRFVELDAFGDLARPIRIAIARQFRHYNQEYGPKPRAGLNSIAAGLVSSEGRSDRGSPGAILNQQKYD